MSLSQGWGKAVASFFQKTLASVVAAFAALSPFSESRSTSEPTEGTRDIVALAQRPLRKTSAQQTSAQQQAEQRSLWAQAYKVLRIPWVLGILLVVGIVLFYIVGGSKLFQKFAQENNTRTQRILGKEEDRQFRLLVKLSKRQVASNIDNWGADLRALASAPRLRAYVEALSQTEEQKTEEQNTEEQKIAPNFLSSEEAAKEFLRNRFLQEMLIVNVEGEVIFVASGNEALDEVDFREESEEEKESEAEEENFSANEVSTSQSLRRVVGDAAGELLEDIYRRAVLFAIEQGSPLLQGEAATTIDSGTQLFFASHTRSPIAFGPETPFAFYALPLMSAERTLLGTLLLFQSRKQFFEQLLSHADSVSELPDARLFFVDPSGTMQILGGGKKLTGVRAWLEKAFVHTQSLGATAGGDEKGGEQHDFVQFRSLDLFDEKWMLVIADLQRSNFGKEQAVTASDATASDATASGATASGATASGATASDASPPLPPQEAFLLRLALFVATAFSLLCLLAGQLLVPKQDAPRRSFGFLLANLLPFQRGERPLPYLERDDRLGEYARILKRLVERARSEGSLQDARSDTRRMDEERSRRLEGLIIAFQEKVQGATGGLASATGHLVQTSDEMRRQSGQAREATQEMLPRVANTTERVRGAAEEIARLTQALDTINRRAQESTLVIRQSVTSTEKADRSAKLLASASESIGSVVQLIQEIAGQVNLLSLNATIESARAGEAGKGFAVVAAEVKNLADQTTKATERIAGLIQNLQTSSAEVLQVLDEIRATVRNAATVVGGISETMQQQRQTGEAVARSMLEAANNVATIQTSFTTVDTASAGADKSAVELSQSVDHLRSQASALEQHIRVFMGDIQKA